MNVSIKRFNVAMSVQTKGIELDVYDGNKKHLGDLVITKSGLVWCKGRTTPANGVRVSWVEFIRWMES